MSEIVKVKDVIEQLKDEDEFYLVAYSEDGKRLGGEFVFGISWSLTPYLEWVVKDLAPVSENSPNIIKLVVTPPVIKQRKKKGDEEECQDITRKQSLPPVEKPTRRKSTSDTQNSTSASLQKKSKKV